MANAFIKTTIEVTALPSVAGYTMPGLYLYKENLNNRIDEKLFTKSLTIANSIEHTFTGLIPGDIYYWQSFVFFPATDYRFLFNAQKFSVDDTNTVTNLSPDQDFPYWERFLKGIGKPITAKDKAIFSNVYPEERFLGEEISQPQLETPNDTNTHDLAGQLEGIFGSREESEPEANTTGQVTFPTSIGNIEGNTKILSTDNSELRIDERFPENIIITPNDFYFYTKLLGVERAGISSIRIKPFFQITPISAIISCYNVFPILITHTINIVDSDDNIQTISYQSGKKFESKVEYLEDLKSNQYRIFLTMSFEGTQLARSEDFVISLVVDPGVKQIYEAE